MKASTYLYESEGRAHLSSTLRHVARATNTFDVNTVVVFAATVASVLKLRDALDDSREVVAVTFPSGFSAMVGNEPTLVGVSSSEDQAELSRAGVSLVRSVMPFHGLGDVDTEQIRSMRHAFGLFGGGMQLCIQAVLMACDAGRVRIAERCISMSADTAIVAHAENAFRFLSPSSRFSVEHTICKPISYTITRPLVVSDRKIFEAAEAPSLPRP